MRLKILPLSTEYGLCCGCSFNFLKPNEQHLIGSHCKSGSGNSCRLFTDKKVDIRVLEILLTIDPSSSGGWWVCVEIRIGLLSLHSPQQNQELPPTPAVVGVLCHKTAGG